MATTAPCNYTSYQYAGSKVTRALCLCAKTIMRELCAIDSQTAESRL